MWQYALKRIGGAIPTALFVLTLVFLAIRILPGDPALAALGDYASAEQLEQFRQRMGLDSPIWQQYASFVWGIMHGDFGRSLANDVSVAALLLRNLPYTIELTIGATLIGIAIGIPTGIVSAVRRNTPPDYFSRVFALLGLSIPDFYLGVLLLISFSLVLGWFPIMGGGEGGLVTRLHHLVLPALTLGLVKAAFVMRLTRSTLLEVFRKDYIRTAQSKGLSRGHVLYKHALRNALIPVATGIGIYLLATLSGSVTIELVFTRPGLGRMLIGAVSARDYTVIQAGLVVFSLFVVLINLLTDLMYAFIDPRIQYG